MADTQDILERCADRARRCAAGETGGRTVRDAALYLAHTGQGASLRALADATGTHPSTVLRAVRRIENRRDDPLFEELIAGAEAAEAAAEAEAAEAAPGSAGDPAAPETEVRRAARSALRRLCEPGAFLLVMPGAARGGIFCAANRHRKPIAMLAVRIAGEFVRRDWIRLAGRGSASLRYRITEAGRSALRRILAEDLAEREACQPAPGLAEAATPFLAQHRLGGTRSVADAATGAPVALAVNLAESPLGWLARRRGADGAPFLAPVEVEAGERLREDFEAAQMGPSVAQDWSRFLAPADRGTAARGARGPAEGPASARARVTAALAALGPGLSDVALRVCCFLEGLECCERRMGWSARSGKVVLKLALQRLVEHYGLAPAGRD